MIGILLILLIFILVLLHFIHTKLCDIETRFMYSNQLATIQRSLDTDKKKE